MEFYEQVNENKNMHIKGKEQLADLAESAKFMTSKFDELQKDRKEKEKAINNLKGKVSYPLEKQRKMVLMLSTNTMEEIVYFSMLLKKLKVKTLTILS